MRPEAHEIETARILYRYEASRNSDVADEVRNIVEFLATEMFHDDDRECDIIANGIYEVHPGTADDLDSYAVVNSRTGAVRADGMTLEDAVEYADELNEIAAE